MFRENDVVYIAGPMSGKSMFNYPKFYGYAGMIEKEWGCKVLNPARQPNGLTYEEYLRRAMEDVKQATVVVMLEGWAESNGARQEIREARKRLDVRIIVSERELIGALERKLKRENKA